MRKQGQSQRQPDRFLGILLEIVAVEDGQKIETFDFILVAEREDEESKSENDVIFGILFLII